MHCAPFSSQLASKHPSQQALFALHSAWSPPLPVYGWMWIPCRVELFPLPK